MNSHLFTPLFSAAAYFVLISVTTAAPLPGQIVANPSNPAWLMYQDGQPFFLASPGDPEGFLYRGSQNGDGTRNGDQLALIQKISGTGANGIYFQTIRSNGGDGDATNNPFVNNDPAQGLNNLVLDQWETWFDEMEANDIVMYMFFYDDETRVWNTGDSVSSAERQYFEAIVNRFEHHANLIWVIAEEYDEQYSATRMSSLAAIIRNADDHDHPIGVHKLNGLTFDEFANDPNIDQFAVQYNSTSATDLHNGMVTAWNNANGRYNVNMSEATQWGTGSVARQKAWAVAMGGAYVMVLGMDIANTPLNDLQDLGRLRLFMESTNFNQMSPRDDLAFDGTDYVLAAPGVGYIAYGVNNPASMGINSMIAGTYNLNWLDPATGVTVNQTSVTISAGANSFNKPAEIGSEVVLYIGVPGTAPNPPSNLVVQ